ncbi:MAG: LytR/AlgR family response regulator transcription factor [Betaproteobacteria bacterium]
MSIRALIADDEPKLAEYLAGRLTELWPELELCGIAVNGNDALAKINNEKPDLVFLDIKMPGISGLEVARRMTHPSLVVFITAFHKFAVIAFEEEAVDYLLKPISDERLLRTIARIKSRYAGKAGAQNLESLLSKLTQAMEKKVSYVRYLRGSSGKVMRLISVDDVLFIYARSKYTFVVTKDGEFLMRMPLSELIRQLDPERFWQIHRSTIVNASKVVSVSQTGRETYVLTVRDYQAPLAVSRAFIHQFKHM